jgi:hypothetical protein
VRLSQLIKKTIETWVDGVRPNPVSKRHCSINCPLHFCYYNGVIEHDSQAFEVNDDDLLKLSSLSVCPSSLSLASQRLTSNLYIVFAASFTTT